MIYTLFGDGIHDDTLAIQELIDNSKGGLSLPQPTKCYLISKPLELPSNFSLTLPRFAEIKLAPNSNCLMLKNRLTDELESHGVDIVYKYLKGKKPEYFAENIEITGGIWNFNNKEQHTNPFITDVKIPDYSGYGMLFIGIKGFRFSSLTLKDPVTFAVTLDTVSYFTVDNIVFDFNMGNPQPWNMDGIHINGNCHFGHIHNLKGRCHDDLVALNADEGSFGPISNITVDGLYAEDCHSCVRLLSANTKVSNIHITNIYGTYYQYCIGITRYQKALDRGFFDCITLDNIYASKAERFSYYKRDGLEEYPVIYIQDGLHIKHLKISNFHRREYTTLLPSIIVSGLGAVSYEEQDEIIEFGKEKVIKPTIIDCLMLDNISVENHINDQEIPLLVNEGIINELYATCIYNNGKKIEL